MWGRGSEFGMMTFYSNSKGLDYFIGHQIRLSMLREQQKNTPTKVKSNKNYIITYYLYNTNMQ